MKTIREMRIALGITQERLAAMLGVTQGTIAQWETGRSHPSFEKLPIVAATLGVTVDELIKSDKIMSARVSTDADTMDGKGA